MPNTEIWGNAVWLLFHTLAEKLSDNYIENNNASLKRIILLICQNLPCPDCASHATETLKNANLDSIKTKEHLKYFFWSFHNIVNHKIGNPIVEFDYLAIYTRAVPRNVVINFQKKFYNRPYNDKLLINSFTMQGVRKELDEYLNNLLQSGVFKL